MTDSKAFSVSGGSFAIETVAIDIVPFDTVTSEHAHAEGDRSLASWRHSHELVSRQ